MLPICALLICALSFDLVSTVSKRNGFGFYIIISACAARWLLPCLPPPAMLIPLLLTARTQPIDGFARRHAHRPCGRSGCGSGCIGRVGGCATSCRARSQRCSRWLLGISSGSGYSPTHRACCVVLLHVLLQCVVACSVACAVLCCVVLCVCVCCVLRASNAHGSSLIHIAANCWHPLQFLHLFRVLLPLRADGWYRSDLQVHGALHVYAALPAELCCLVVSYCTAANALAFTALQGRGSSRDRGQEKDMIERAGRGAGGEGGGIWREQGAGRRGGRSALSSPSGA